MLGFLAILAYSFRDVGRALAQCAASSTADQSLIWGAGALLFGFTMNFWSISLFDQSVIFFYLCLAAIQSIVRQPALLPPSNMYRAGVQPRRQGSMLSHEVPSDRT